MAQYQVFHFYAPRGAHHDGTVPVSHVIGGDPDFAMRCWDGKVTGCGYRSVASVKVEDPDVLNNLEMCFQLTNHIDRDWRINQGVTALPTPQRSTGVGDIVKDSDGALWVVMGCGFKQVGFQAWA